MCPCAAPPLPPPRPSSSQAQEVLAAIQACRHRYYVAPRSEAASWREMRAPASAASSSMMMMFQRGGRGLGGQEHPDTLLSLEFKPVWYRRGGSGGGSGASGRSVSVWRPVGPPGYVALGDVAVVRMGGDSPCFTGWYGLCGSGVSRSTGPYINSLCSDDNDAACTQLGIDAPPSPVRLYRDPLATGGNDGDAPTEGPRLCMPVGYTLVFRDSALPPVTIWRPLPPRGYAEVSVCACGEGREG